MQNVDFKCELRDPELARIALRKLGAQFVHAVEQIDTYYRVPDGRLKKREAHGEPIEYIFYHRINRPQPKLSHFTIYTEDQVTQRFGTRPLPVWLTVRKTREIYLLRGTHIHIDNVQELGHFLEVDALVSPNQHVGRCHRLIGKIRELLGPALGEPIATGYADLMQQDKDNAA